MALDRAPKGRLRTTTELAQRIGRQCAAHGVVRRREQPALVDADSGPPGAEGASCALRASWDA